MTEPTKEITMIWLIIGLAAWLAVGIIVGVVLGRVTDARDLQVPRDSVPPPIDPL
jgi:hypothetical protein